MKALLNKTVVAEADKKDVIYIEGMWYFPPHAVKQEFLKSSDTKTTCHWKGEASYYDVSDGETTAKDSAFSYDTPKEGSVEVVKKDFAGYIAFWRDVSVADD